MVGATVKEVGKQLNKVFTVDEIKKEIITKLGTLEKRIDSSVYFSNPFLPLCYDDRIVAGFPLSIFVFLLQRRGDVWSKWKSTSWTLLSYETPFTTSQQTLWTTTD